MRNRPIDRLGRVRTLLLSTCAVAAFAIPIAIGVMRGPRLLAMQEPTPGTGPRFDVVSVKRNTSGALGGLVQSPPGRYTATNIPLRMLIRNAYGVLDSQIVGGPQLATADFFSGEHFDINATYTGTATREEVAAMLRNMLADRFALVTHTEARDMPVYALVRSRADGSLGPQLKPAADPACSSPAAQQERDAGRSGPPPALPQGGRGVIGRPNCGALLFGPGQYDARAVGIGQLVNALGNQGAITGIDRPILDRTGLADRYDFELRWRMAVSGRGGAAGAGPAAEPDRPDLFTALQEQLGLKLETQRAPIEVLVIDKAEMPKEN